MNNCVFELMSYFPESRILPDCTLVLDLRGLFKIDLKKMVSNDFHLHCIVLETLPHQLLFEHAYKTLRNDLNYKNAILESMNAYLGSDLSLSDMKLIRNTLYGGYAHKLTEAFVRSGYNLEVLR